MQWTVYSGKTWSTSWCFSHFHHQAINSHHIDMVDPTQWGLNKMAHILQTTFWNEFSSMKNQVFWIKFHWTVFQWVWLTMSTFRSGNGLEPSGNKPLSDPMLSKFFYSLWCHYASMSWYVLIALEGEFNQSKVGRCQGMLQNANPCIFL